MITEQDPTAFTKKGAATKKAAPKKAIKKSKKT
jgi:hypothetical protein